MKHKDGHWVDILSRSTVVHDEQGIPVRMVGTHTDISIRKRLDEQLVQAQKMESIGLLAGGIAHDFNNLLTPIMGFLDLVLMDLPPDDQNYTQLSTVRNEAKMAADLTRQILAFSRKQVLETQECDLNIVIQNFNKMIQRLIGENIKLHINAEKDLNIIKADVSQIEQVLMNLTINSRDAMPSGGELIIETSNVYLDEAYVNKYAETILPGDYVFLAFSDTGIGMDSEATKHIFDPFYTTKEAGKGTGLGLSTVFGIIKQHSGHISVYSEPGKGTTFKIYLPVSETAVYEKTKSIDKKEIVSLYGTESVIVVEDKESLCNLIYHALSSYGYKVYKYQKASEAIQFISENNRSFNLLITDVIMAEMNGKELHQKISVSYPEIRVLFISGYTENLIAHHGILDEGVFFLQKPFSIQSLLQKVRTVLS